MPNESKEYHCECGRVFTKSSQYIGHCGHCKVHLGEERYQKNHEITLQKQRKATDTRTEILKKQSEDFMAQWISDMLKLSGGKS